jgi:hypothetical protein
VPADSDVPANRGIAVALAEAYLDVLSGGSREELKQCVGRRAEQLLMGADGRPYLITVTGAQPPAGGLYLYVSVSDGGWDGGIAVVRSAVLTFGSDGGRRKRRRASR